LLREISVMTDDRRIDTVAPQALGFSEHALGACELHPSTRVHLRIGSGDAIGFARVLQ
jgi:hypothetical protein